MSSLSFRVVSSIFEKKYIFSCIIYKSFDDYCCANPRKEVEHNCAMTCGLCNDLPLCLNSDDESEYVCGDYLDLVDPEGNQT